MHFHQSRSFFAPMCCDRVDQRLMRIALASGLPPLPIKRNNERGTRQQIPDETRQDRMAGNFGQMRVEQRRQHDRFAVASSMKCLMLIMEMLAQLLDLFRLDDLSC